VTSMAEASSESLLLARLGLPESRVAWVAPPTLRDATQVQRIIAEQAETADRIGLPREIAGVDVSMNWRDTRGPIHAAVAPIRWPELDACAPATATILPRFPYVSGYLGFREVPALLAAFAEMERLPDLIFVDGQGRAHPRRCGVATQLGVILDLPTIGVAKSLLCGEMEGVLADTPGATAPIVHKGEAIALALRTRARCNPLFVSSGHRVSLETAVAWVLRLCAGRRQPLPIRLAHDAANAARRQATA
jgi:deoxyribonuclease V